MYIQNSAVLSITATSYLLRHNNIIQANIYLLKVNNRNSRKRCEFCSKLTMKTPERRH